MYTFTQQTHFFHDDDKCKIFAGSIMSPAWLFLFDKCWWVICLRQLTFFFWKEWVSRVEFMRFPECSSV